MRRPGFFKWCLMVALAAGVFAFAPIVATFEFDQSLNASSQWLSGDVAWAGSRSFKRRRHARRRNFGGSYHGTRNFGSASSVSTLSINPSLKFGGHSKHSRRHKGNHRGRHYVRRNFGGVSVGQFSARSHSVRGGGYGRLRLGRRGPRVIDAGTGHGNYAHAGYRNRNFGSARIIRLDGTHRHVRRFQYGANPEHGFDPDQTQPTARIHEIGTNEPLDHRKRRATVDGHDICAYSNCGYRIGNSANDGPRIIVIKKNSWPDGSGANGPRVIRLQ